MVFLSVGSVFAADETGKNFIFNKVGVGYQGMVVGSFLNGISVRGWIGDRIGLEASGYYGSADIQPGSDEVKADLWTIEAKAMYAVVVRNYSKFYVGGKIGYGQIDASEDNNKFDNKGFWTPGVFVGAEWSFPQLPEVGFNFDVGYSGILYDNDDVKINLNGINATFGIHYYF
jgi:hypothetical protein